MDIQKITAKYEVLLAASQAVMKPDELQLLDKAYQFALDTYGDRMHLSGELLITHSLSIARIAVEEMGLGINSVIAALFHDILTLQLADADVIKKQFGPVINGLVVSYARISDLPTGKVSLQSDTFRKLFLAVVDDIRVILLETGTPAQGYEDH